MGWMTWNYFAENINEKDIKEMADAMVSSGMAKAGYQYIFIDDGWQGGRDNRNNIIPDAKKFPSGIKALADYVHSKGLKLGIYSDAAQLTCAGYTASVGFEEQDAKTFALWGIDYLKYDYCNAPEDPITAQVRYKAMADALRKSGRDIAFGICEWGNRKPWLWAASVGGQLWRTTADVRDKWSCNKQYTNQNELHSLGAGILDIIDVNAALNVYSGPGHWNDMDMLVVGLYGKKGPSGDLGGVGCTDTEYQTQMSMWCMMNSVLAATNDIRNMNENTKRLLMNEEIIAISQDSSGKQAERKINAANWNVFIKQLANGDYAIALLNRGGVASDYQLNFADLGLTGNYEIRDVWEHKVIGKTKQWKGNVKSHETKVFRLKRIP
ncbi:MAG: glycoside hydrolase family 27 protein [Sphingobacteriales bacterium]|nr:glycoside hydrolase family 27 protein [Sphingobacteriales bacterium]MBI3717709.1 glycoside hydrolase family 27 protein [Sphingobacteriales bacterium]